MVTDRVSTACLLAILSQVYRPGLIFLALLGLDITSHWLQMYRRCFHSLPFATIAPEEISCSQPAQVHNLVLGSWKTSTYWNTIGDPLNGEPFIKVAEVPEAETKPFEESLSKCPKYGLHNPFRAPERYLLYGDVSIKAAHFLGQPEVLNFFARLIQRVSPKSYELALREVYVTQKFFENFCGDQNWASSSLVPQMKELAERRKMEDLTIGPVLTVTTDQTMEHVENLLAIPGSKLLFGGQPLENHSIQKSMVL